MNPPRSPGAAGAGPPATTTPPPRRCGAALALLVALGLTPAAPAQTVPLTFELVTDVTQFLPRRTDLELRGSRQPTAEEQVMVEIGGLDVTDLVHRRGRSLVFRSALMPLPAGESEVVVWLQRPGVEPLEALRTTIRVRTRHGLDAFSLSPTADLEGIAQVASGHAPDDGFARPDFEKATGQLRLETSLARSGWRLDGAIALLGASEVEDALRFGERGEEASRLDLASYLLRLEKGQGFVELGHTVFGEQRHLIQSFSSRGLQLGAPLGALGRVSLFAGSGSEIVGFDDPSGFSRRQHRVAAGTVELSPLPGAGDALRVELSWVDGSLLPLADFNQGVINDAEESHGYALRLRGSPGSRVRFDAGLATSTFSNPADPLLDQGGASVPTEEEVRHAYYADLDLVLLRRASLGGWSHEVTLSLAYERVDPLYRSVAAYAQSDYEQSRATLSGISGPISYSARSSRSADNLDDIPSILETRTRTSGLQLALPLSQVWGRLPRPALLPTLTLSQDRTAQVGSYLPENGGFSASHVPDQVSLARIAGLEWQGNRWRFAVQLSSSDQDNRQAGRENADFEQLNHTLQLDLALFADLDLGFELSRERAESIADAAVSITRRPAFHLSWRTTDRLEWSGSYSITDTTGASGSGKSRVATVDGAYRLSFREERAHGVSGQLFARYNREELDEIDGLFGFALERRDWTLQIGLNLGFR